MIPAEKRRELHETKSVELCIYETTQHQRYEDAFGWAREQKEEDLEREERNLLREVNQIMAWERDPTWYQRSLWGERTWGKEMGAGEGGQGKEGRGRRVGEGG